MELCGRRRGDSLLVEMTGELDQQAADAVRTRIDAVLKDTTIRFLILDMSGVSFMDSTGIGVILGRYRLMIARGGTVSITGACGSIERILRMSGMQGFINRDVG